MTMRLKRSLAVTLALLMYVQPITQTVYATTATTASRQPVTAPRADYAPETTREQAPPVPVVVFGPAVYLRTAGSPNIYDVTFNKPAWMNGPYTLHVVNGTVLGLNRLSSSTITLNGVEVASSSDFGQSVAVFDKNVTLQAQNTMQVRVTSIPLGFMTVSIVAQNGDRTPPALTFVSPVAGGFSNTATTQIVLRATDVLGIGDVGLSGILASSLAVNVDGTNRSSLFSLVNGDFVGNVPALPEGSHTVAVSIADVAGNVVGGSISFTIDRTPPQITIASPTAGQYTNAGTISVQGGVVDATTTAVVVNGSAATVTGSQFTAAAIPVGAPPSQVINVQATDAANNTATASVTINVDRTAPAVTFVSPVPGGFSNAESTQIVLRAADVLGAGELTMSAVAPATLAVSVDGANQTAAFSLVNGEFVGTLPLAEGSHSVNASIADVAGNVGAGSMSFTVDRTLPAITFVSPAAGGFSNTEDTRIAFRAADGTAGIAGSTLSVTVDGTDHTSLFAVVDGDFVGTVPALAEGAHTVNASVGDVAGNTASGSLSFTIDRTPPQLVVVDPAANQYTNAAAIDVRGGVIDATATSVTVDGAPATVINSEFTATAVPIGSGPTQAINIQAADAAGNVATTSVTINIDRVPPAIAFTSPVEGAAVKGPILDVAGTVSDTSVVIVQVNGEMMTVSGGTFSGQVPAGDGATVLHATAQDAAGNQASADRTISVDTVAPIITILEPAPDTITNQTSIVVRGSVADSSATIVRAGGADITPVGGVFEATLLLASEGTNVLIVTATDAAGNEAMAGVNIITDRTAPVLAITSPAAGAVVSTLPVTVQGTVQDVSSPSVTVNGAAATIAGATWTQSIDNLPEGPATFSVLARDLAGNESTASRAVVIDLTAPVVTITTPQSGLLTSDGSVAVTGTVQDFSVSAVLVNGVAATLDAATVPGAPRGFTATVPLSEGDNAIVASATDGASRDGTATVTVTRDSTPPSVSLTVGPKVTRTRPAAASVVATDNLVLDRVTVTVNGTLVQTFTTPPFALDISAPEAARPGDVLTVVATAFDRVGNSAQSAAMLPVASDGAVVGQVLSDVTGRPVGAAVVSVDGSAPLATDDRGRYSFATGEPRVSLTVSAAGMTSVDRSFDIVSEAGTVALDARLTPIAPPTAVSAAEATLTVAQSGGAVGVPLSLVVPAGAFTDGASINATALSGQGLPGLLPLGWSPIAALDLRGPVAAQTVTLRAEFASTQAVYLSRYANRTWSLASDALTPDGTGVISVALPAADALAVALVVADINGPAVPAVGDPLTGVETAEIPLTATSTGVLDPPVLSPGGGTSIGTLTIVSPTPLPSGTVVQAVVTETFTLTSGDTISEEARNQDFVLYRAQPGLVATFPVVPSRSFDAANLVQGIVHLDILAGRETVRGRAGGSGAVTLTTTGATLSIAQGTLSEDVPIAFQPAVLSSFLPATADVAPMLEFSIDFSGRTLSSGAEMAVLASQLAGLGPDDAVVIVRVDSIEGRTRLVPVALGELNGDRYIARATHGLAGITRGGRHVWYRIAGGVGFVRGSIDANGTALSAIVEVIGLPFASLSAPTGQYTVLARPGTAALRARAPGTALIGEASADVTINNDSVRDITLDGEVTVAAIAPATGTTNVPVSVQVEVASATSITAASVATASIQFTRTSDPAGAVPYRVVLSGSGRTLAIVPLTRLADGATYRVEISGLADAVGGAVTVPVTSFTTQSNSSPQYDLDKLVFTFPNEQGEVILNGPPGTLAPGSTILVINESTGEVSSLGVNNDGSVSEVGGRLIAHIADRLIVTITDPLGRTTTFKRSEYVAEDGTTAVGAGGGEIVGAGGVEVRIPEDAVMNGVAAILKISAVPPDQLPAGPLPEIDVPSGVATVATSLKIESTDTPGFQKEVDLVFPKPADAPENAVYFVYRRLVGPDGRIAYETLDFADVEGEGENAKVVTASEPYSGYIDSISSFTVGGFDQLGAVGGQLTNYSILMFFYDLALPGRALGGTVQGKVQRLKWAPNATTPTYEPVPGAMVRATDAGGDPLFDGSASNIKVAKTQASGTYALYDRRYEGGSVTVYATDPATGQVVTATAYQVDPQTTKSPGLRFSRHIATANIVLPPIAPEQPAPSVQLKVMTVDAAGVRQPTNGIVVAGQPILIGIKAGDNTVQRVDIKSGTSVAEYGVRPDPLRTFDVIADSGITLPNPGSYTITVTALAAGGGVVTGRLVVRSAAAGGGNNESLPDDAPAVITERSVPKQNAGGVAIGVLAQISFTEPVQNVPDSVSLSETTGGVGIRISGVGPDGPIEHVTSSSIVTSITIEPLEGLKYGTRYTLELTDGIFDTDDGSNGTDAHKKLTPYVVNFTTFTPEEISQQPDTFTAGGFAVIGNRAFVATPQNSGRWFTLLRQFDVSDPTAPIELSGAPNGSEINKQPPAWWLGLPVDVASEAESEWTGGSLVAVATTPLSYPFHSSNVRLYDVSNEDTWRWIGAVSLGREPSDGMIRRIRVKGSMLFAATAGMGKGIQIVDLEMVRALFSSATSGGERTQGYWSMLGQLNSTNGFAQETIVQTIPVNTGSGDNSQLWDLALTDMPIDGITETAIVATGRSPLVIASASGGLLYNGDITFGAGGGALTSWGYGVAAGMVGDKPIAAVAAVGGAGPSSGSLVLAIVDITDPRAPRALDILTLPGSGYGVQDVVLRDNKVYIGTATNTLVVSVVDPTHPELIGAIEGVSGRLAFTEDGLLMGTHRTLGRTTAAEGGLRTAVLDKFLLVSPDQETVLTSADSTIRSVDITYRLFSGDEAPATIRVDVLRGFSPVQQLPAPFDGEKGETKWPAGSPVQASSSYFVRAIVNEGTPDELASRAVRLPVTDIQVLMEEERKALVMAALEGSTVVQNTYDDGSGLEPPVASYDYKNSSRTFAKTITTEFGTPPDLEDDYVVLRIKAKGGLVWAETGNTSITLPVPSSGEVEATLKATAELAALQVETIDIVLEYFPDKERVQPLRTSEDHLRVLNKGLYGHLSNIVAGVFGRGEGMEARVAELGAGLIPVAGDAAGIVSELVNGLDPNTDVSKVNAALSVAGLATEFGVFAGPVGVAMDKVLVILRLGLKQIENVTGPLRSLPNQIWTLVKARTWDALLDQAQGSLKFAWLGGGELAEKIVRDDADIALLNRMVKSYSDNLLDARFVELVQRVDSVFDDPDAIRGAIRVLSEVTDATGTVIRLSDDAVEGAAKFMARVGSDLSPQARELMLKRLMSSAPADAEFMLRYVKNSTNPSIIKGMRAILEAADGVCQVVPR